MSRSDSRIYIGNLPPDIRTKDIEDLFYKYGKIKFIDLKNRKGPPFAFIEFEDTLDAEDAIKGRDNYDFDGYKLRVEFQKGSRNGPPSSHRAASSRSGPPTRRSDHRVIITGLPSTGSWQDLKDHMRVAGNVCYADVFKDGTGVVEFIRYEDAKYAVKNLDDTKFRSHEGETSYVRVKLDSSKKSGGARSVSRSNSRSRSRSSSYAKRRERASPSYSPVKKSRSRSRSYDDGESSRRRKRSKRSVSRSASRSRSRSRNRDRRRSRSRSRSPRLKSKSRSRSRDRRSASESKEAKSRSRTRSRSNESEGDRKKTSQNGESTSGANGSAENE